jgi:hypothetical protein
MRFIICIGRNFISIQFLFFFSLFIKYRIEKKISFQNQFGLTCFNIKYTIDIYKKRKNKKKIKTERTTVNFLQNNQKPKLYCIHIVISLCVSLFQKTTGAQQHVRLLINIDNVRRGGQLEGDVLGSLDTTQLDQSCFEIILLCLRNVIVVIKECSYRHQRRPKPWRSARQLWRHPRRQ